MNDRNRIEYIETLHLSQAATRLILEGADLVVTGGNEGIQAVAQTQPETIIGVIVALAGVIKKQSREILELSEERFDLIDKIEELTKK